MAGAVRQRDGQARHPARRRPGSLPGHSNQPGRGDRLCGAARPDGGSAPGYGGTRHRRRGHRHPGPQGRGTGGHRRPAPADAGGHGGDKKWALR